MYDAIVFDVNGTLLRTDALDFAARRIVGIGYSAERWFEQVAGYAMATTLAGDYREFGDIAIAVLEMAASARGRRVSAAERTRIRKRLRQLPSFPEVPKALQQLKRAGHRLIALSNSSGSSLSQQLTYAEIDDCFEQTFSVDAVQRFKPAHEPYQHVADALGLQADRMLMVAAHSWDLLGAARAGYRTALVCRPGKAPLPGAPTLDHTAENLTGLANELLGRSRMQRHSAAQYRRRRRGIGDARGLNLCGIAQFALTHSDSVVAIVTSDKTVGVLTSGERSAVLPDFAPGDCAQEASR